MPADCTKSPKPRVKKPIPKASDFTDDVERAIAVAIVDTVLAARPTIASRPELATVSGNGGSELSKKIIVYLKGIKYGPEAVELVVAARKGQPKAAKVKASAKTVKAEAMVKSQEESDDY